MFQVSSWDIPYLPSESMVCSTGNFSALRSSPCFPVPRVHVLRVIKVDGTEAADCEFSKSVSVKNDGCANDLLQKWPSNDAFFKKNDVNDGDIKYVPCGYFVGIWTEASQSGGFTLQQLAGMKPLNVRLLCFLKPPLLSQDSKLRFDISEDDCPIRYCQLGFLNCFFSMFHFDSLQEKDGDPWSLRSCRSMRSFHVFPTFCPAGCLKTWGRVMSPILRTFECGWPCSPMQPHAAVQNMCDGAVMEHILMDKDTRSECEWTV